MDVDFSLDRRERYPGYSPFLPLGSELAFINPGVLIKHLVTIRKPLDLDKDEDFNFFALFISEICFHEFLHIFGRRPGEPLIQCGSHGEDSELEKLFNPKIILDEPYCYLCDLTFKLMLEKQWLKLSMVPSTG